MRNSLLVIFGVLIILFGTCVFGVFQISNFKFQIVKWCGGSLPFVQQIDKLFSGRYVVLLQNNYELRATGGFMGSYAVVDFKNGLNVHVKDIYDADGKLPGHVEPPYPIQEAFLQGWWKLRDSNWKVDFPAAALDVNWFLEQGGEKNIDGIVAVNMELFKKWLDVMGGVEVVTYGQTVTSKNMYVLAQTAAETNFVPGSTHKRDFLGAVGTSLLENTKTANPFKLFKLALLIKSELSNRQILLWFKDSALQAEAHKWKWDGSLPTLPFKTSYLYVVESNLGSNKANCCIKRDVYINENGLKITWHNNNEFSQKMPPVFWGGDYYDYLRIVVKDPKIQRSKDPKIVVDGRELRKATGDDFLVPNSLRKSISWDIYNLEDYGDFQIIGFWVRTDAKKRSVAKININLLDSSALMIDRQPGIDSFGLQIERDGKLIYNRQLANREIIRLN